MAIIAVTISDGDDLPNLAYNITGATENWPALAAFNHLRAPYISNDPRDQWGSAPVGGNTTIAYSIGTNTFTITPTPPSSLVQIGGTFLLGMPGSDGSWLIDPLKISTYAHGTITTTTNTTKNFPIGSSWGAYPVEGGARVLKTGDTLYIPRGDVPNIRALDKILDLYGTDIAMDDSGLLTWASESHSSGTISITLGAVRTQDVFMPSGTPFGYNLQALVTTSDVIIPSGSGATVLSVPVKALDIGAIGDVVAGTTLHTIPSALTPQMIAALQGSTIVVTDSLRSTYRQGDFGTVTGYANLAQALSLRIATEKGELPYHATYGNEAHKLIGGPDRATEELLASSFSADCALQDDRVAKIDNLGISRETDAFYISLGVQPRGTSERIAIDDLRLRFISSTR